MHRTQEFLYEKPQHYYGDKTNMGFKTLNLNLLYEIKLQRFVVVLP